MVKKQQCIDNDESEDLQTMESEDDDDEPEVMKKRSIRNYMAQMRKTDTIFENQKFNNGTHVSLIDQGHILIKAQ